MTKKTTIYTDPTGQTVPAKFVPSYDKKRDAIARKIHALWNAENKRLADIKTKTNDLIDQMQELSNDDTNVKPLGGAKGNIQFRSFDGSITIARDMQQCTEFDERLQLAQTLIKQAIAEMTANIPNADLVTIATNAFTPRRNGNLDMQRIRDLTRLKVNHPKWKQACDIIKDCERTIGSRQYIRVSIRTTPDEKPEPISLDIAKV